MQSIGAAQAEASNNEEHFVNTQDKPTAFRPFRA
jgi:hypothetical protein